MTSKTQTLFAYARITAPFAGVITHRYADTGAMIQAGTSSQTQTMPIVRLSQIDTLRLVIPVPESAVSRIQLSAPVTVSVHVAAQDRYRGRRTVRRSPRHRHADDACRSGRANPTLELVPGMYADATIVARTRRRT